MWNCLPNSSKTALYEENHVYLLILQLIKVELKASKMAQEVRVLVAKPDNLSSILGSTW